MPKVLHDAKPAEQATLNTHFQKHIGLSTVCNPPIFVGGFQFVEKDCFLKNSEISLSLQERFVGFASLQSWSFVVGASCTDFVQPLVCVLA